MPLIVFVSDNGFSCGQHGFWGKGNGTNPRNAYENSIKVPALFSQPGRIPVGSRQNDLVSAYDFMPTLLDYLEVPIPCPEQLPGRSFQLLLEGQNIEGRKDVVVFDEYGPMRMIRTTKWKLVYRHASGPHELYDLENDPEERSNRIDAPEQQQRISELYVRMSAWFQQYVDPEIDGLKRPMYEMGGQMSLAKDDPNGLRSALPPGKRS